MLGQGKGILLPCDLRAMWLSLSLDPEGIKAYIYGTVRDSVTHSLTRLLSLSLRVSAHKAKVVSDVSSKHIVLWHGGGESVRVSVCAITL